jgi:hypothetical protein
VPLQNRVDPFGALIAVPERGTLFGNRGVLHDGARRIVRHHRGKRWIACLLEFRGRHRAVMQPGRYTELFFLDEATALAAGHRPCAECRRQEYEVFRRCWVAASGGPSGGLPSADAMDAALHGERLVPAAGKRTYRAEVAGLPEGVFVVLDGEAWLLWDAALWHWTPGGYDRWRARPAAGEVTLLTPPVMVATITAGYVPGVHGSARGGVGSKSPPGA